MKTALSPVYLMALDLIDRFDDEFLQLASVLRHLKETDPESLKSLLAERRLGQRKAYCVSACKFDPLSRGIGVQN